MTEVVNCLIFGKSSKQGMVSTWLKQSSVFKLVVPSRKGGKVIEPELERLINEGGIELPESVEWLEDVQ